MWQGSLQDQQQDAVEGALAAPCWRLSVSVQTREHCKHEKQETVTRLLSAATVLYCCCLQL